MKEFEIRYSRNPVNKHLFTILPRTSNYATWITVLLCAVVSHSQSPTSTSTTAVPEEPPKFSVGQRSCKPRFSELATLYLGIDAQRNQNDFDEFIELDFPKKECEKMKKLVLQPYTIAVIDTRPNFSTTPGPLFYCNLHQHKMKDKEFYFVIGNQSDNSLCTREFDIAFEHGMSGVLINSISPDLFNGLHFAAEPEDKSHFPVIFLLLESPALLENKNKFKDLAKELSYAKVGRARKVTLIRTAQLLSRRDLWPVMFDNAVDAVIVSRNLTVTRQNTFTSRLFAAFATRGVKPSMIAVEVDADTRDLPKGRSISLCIPEEEDTHYTKTHTSVYWKDSSHTPGERNDCSSPEYLRVFDEKTNYNSADIAEYRYPSVITEPEREEHRAEELRQPATSRPQTPAEERTGSAPESLPFSPPESPQVLPGGSPQLVPSGSPQMVPIGSPQMASAQSQPSSPTDSSTVGLHEPAPREVRVTVCPSRGEGDVVPVSMTQFSYSSFSYEEKNKVMNQLDYLFRSAVSNERLHHRENRERARTAMLNYESMRRRNFISRDLDLLLKSGNFPCESDRRKLETFTNEKFQYFKPLFPNEWSRGKRVIRIRCEPCYEYLHKQGRISAYAISSEKGEDFTLGVEKKLRNHIRADQSIHSLAVEEYTKTTDERVSNWLGDVDRAPTDPGISMRRLFLLAYTAAKMYLPPYQFPTLCQTLSVMGLEIGEKHHTRDGFVKMTAFISQSMRKTLINYIRINQSPFSLLVDTSTDPGSRQVLLIFIRFPDRISMHPTTHFLEALEMTESESGMHIFEAIYSYFKKIDLLQEYTWNLVAVATDGASAMNAEGGLRGILNRNVSESRKNSLLSRGATTEELSAIPSAPIIWMHCMAHKIELALTDAFAAPNSQFAQWRKFATYFLNRIRSFFAAPSRRRVLMEVHETVEGETFINLKRVIAIRWASSEESAIRSFLRMYKHIWVALQRILLSGSNRKDRLKAAAFLHVIKSLKFYRYMLFQLIVLEGIGQLSREAQSESTSIWKAQEDLQKAAEQLKVVARSPHANKKTLVFLESVLCKRAADTGNFRTNAASMAARRWFWNGWQYENAAERIKYRLQGGVDTLDFSMEAEGERDPEQQRIAEITDLLRTERNDLIGYIRNPSIKPNFDEDVSRRSIDELQVVEEFKAAEFTNMDQPKRFLLVNKIIATLKQRIEYPADSVLHAAKSFSPDALTDYNALENDNRRKVSKFLNFPGDRIEFEFEQLSTQLKASLPAEVRAELTKAREKMQYFLPVLRKHMQSRPPSLTDRRLLMSLLEKLLSIPISTAEVERGFSIYSVIREPRRGRTTVEHLSNYLRIAISGPDRLSPYEFLRYPKDWQETGRQTADFPGRTRGPGKKSLQRLEEEANFKAIFDPDRFFTQFYFSLSDETPGELDIENIESEQVTEHDEL